MRYNGLVQLLQKTTSTFTRWIMFMSDSIPIFRIFLSSPGDVSQERNDAETVIREINESNEFTNYFMLKLFRWDDKTVVLPMSATDIPQKSVDMYMTRPSECDLVVVLLWSRMGSPLVMDEREYLSGTYYEYSEALEGYHQTGKPTIWLYRCSEEPVIKLSDPERDERIRQYDRVTQFFKQFRDADGRLTGGVNEYETHDDFKALFKAQLITYLRHLRDNPRKPITSGGSSRPKFSGEPYRGLNALDEEDAPIFFGRDAETLEVLSRIDQKRLVFVLGASGSGKSSLVAAGVLPKLRERGWHIVRCIPGDDPFFNLAMTMISQLTEYSVAPVNYLPEARKLADTLRSDHQNLARQITLTLPKRKVLLFIDQFEEVFTLAENNPTIKNDKRDDVTTFIQAISHHADKFTAILTMRADFYGIALPHFKVLKQEAYGLTQPSVFALYDLITRPAELAGLQLDEGLAHHIVDEVGSEAGGLALVAYLMEALYLRAKSRGDTHLTWEDYNTLGGVKGSINTLANKAYAELPFEESVGERAMQTVFRELVILTEEDGQLIPTRRRAPLSTFDPGSVEAQFIETFVGARLLVSNNTSLEVAHEAILQHWTHLNKWIVSVQEDLILLRQVRVAADEWLGNGKPDYLRWPDERLQPVYRMIDRLHLDTESAAGFSEVEKTYIEKEFDRLLRELHSSISHSRRRQVGERISVIGDTRKGVALDERGLPDIVWCPVEETEVEIEGSEGKQTHVVPAFGIAKYPITYVQFQCFIEDGGYETDKWWDGFTVKPSIKEQRFRFDNNPRENISWYEAVAFTRWLSEKVEYEVRLPTEAEWQSAAMSGDKERIFPWGNVWASSHANTIESGLNGTIAVGLYPENVALCGTVDLCGNVEEWTASKYDNNLYTVFDDNDRYILRGGSWRGENLLSKSTYRFRANPEYRSENIGFRVCATAPIIDSEGN